MDEASTQTGPSDPTPSTKSLDEGSWELLLKRIRDKRCTPFLGAGMSPHPSAVDIAHEWALAEGYPLADGTDLARVAQFIGVKEDAMAPKERLLTRFRSTPSPDFSDPLEPHRVLADLELPMYITTNYDRFMIEALEAPGRSPARVVCRWNESMERKKPPKPPDSANPWVFHLHGSDDDPQSLVLTEDDYLDFLVRSQQDEKMLPPKVRARWPARPSSSSATASPTGRSGSSSGASSTRSRPRNSGSTWRCSSPAGRPRKPTSRPISKA